MFVCRFLSSGAEGAPAELRGGDQRSARPGVHQGGPPRQAGGSNPVQSQRVEGRLRSRRRSVRRTRRVQHRMVSVWLHICCVITATSAVKLRVTATSSPQVETWKGHLIILFW